MTVRRLLPALLTLVALVALAPSASAAGHGKRATARSFSGTVVNTVPRRHSLSLRTGARRTVKLRVGRTARGAKLARLRKGQKVVVRAVRTRRGWTATRITLSKVSATDESADDQGADDEDLPADDEDVSGDDESSADDSGDTATGGDEPFDDSGDEADDS